MVGFLVVIDKLRLCRCSNGRIKVWNTNTGVLERAVEGHTIRWKAMQCN
jgi:hypothetical protein